MCVYIYIYIYIYIYTHTHTHKCIWMLHTYTQTHVYMCVCVFAQLYSPVRRLWSKEVGRHPWLWPAHANYHVSIHACSLM